MANRPDVDQAILDNFWHISEEDETKRINGIKTIISTINSDKVISTLSM